MLQAKTEVLSECLSLLAWFGLVSWLGCILGALLGILVFNVVAERGSSVAKKESEPNTLTWCVLELSWYGGPWKAIVLPHR